MQACTRYISVDTMSHQGCPITVVTSTLMHVVLNCLCGEKSVPDTPLQAPQPEWDASQGVADIIGVRFAMVLLLGLLSGLKQSHSHLCLLHDSSCEPTQSQIHSNSGLQYDPFDLKLMSTLVACRVRTPMIGPEISCMCCGLFSALLVVQDVVDRRLLVIVDDVYR